MQDKQAAGLMQIGIIEPENFTQAIGAVSDGFSEIPVQYLQLFT
jgi:hypothetical protein